MNFQYIQKQHKRKPWSMINNTFNGNRGKQTINHFIINDQEITDPNLIATKFTEYFVNIGRSLANKIIPFQHFTEYFPNETDTRFKFKLINEDLVLIMFDKL